jgi:formylglycine-generating enzyme required for sulfatase activity
LSDWVLATEQSGHTRHYAAAALPVAIGGNTGDDLVLGEVAGSIQIGRLDDVFFVQPMRGTENVRLDSEPLSGSRRLADGSVIALDTARLTCRLRDGRLQLAIEAQITAGDTAPPDFEALARDQSEVTVNPIAFNPGAGKARGERRLSRASLVVYAAFVVLATLAWFAFTAKSVRFETTPVAASVDLPGTWFKFPLDDRWMLRPGTYRVMAEFDGYYPIDEQVEIDQGSSQVVELEFVRLPGLISFATEPEAEAEVSIDGELVGTTPISDLEVRPGTHQVQFTAERFLTELVSIEVEGGHAKDSIAVELTPSWAPVRLSSVPSGAGIRVDGRALGETPAELELTAGEREIEFVLPGYNPLRRQIRVVANEPQTVPEARLTPADGRLSLSSEPADASISVNGEYLGTTPRELDLRPDVEYVVSVAKPGYERETVTLSLPPGGRESIEFDLVEQIGVVEFATDPAGAEVLVNGEVRGTTPLSLELMAVETSIAIRLDGFADLDETITPVPGYTQQLPFELVPLDEATGGGFARTITTAFGQRLRLIPAGSLTMGASRSDTYALVREHNRFREVEITRAFYLAETEMTNAQYRECDPDHDSGGYEGHALNEPDQPVVRVTVQQIFACLNRLSLREGLQPAYAPNGGILAPVAGRNGYRLATEAEFALALRVAGRDAAEPLRFAWGDSPNAPPEDRIENIADLTANDVLDNILVTYNDGFPVSAPVGSFPPNAAGLYDMGGNVSEWVQDFYDPLEEFGDELIVDPQGPETGRQNIVRGPSWRSVTVRQLRLSYLEYESNPREDVGFRIARNLE